MSTFKSVVSHFFFSQDLRLKRQKGRGRGKVKTAGKVIFPVLNQNNIALKILKVQNRKKNENINFIS